MRLFTRHASVVKLTIAGQTFAEQVQLLIKQGKHLQQVMAPFAEGLNSQMILWCNSSAQSEYLPLLLPQYRVENPTIHIDLKEAETNDIIQALEKDTAQLGLISSFFNSGHLQTLEFIDDPLVLICPLNHELKDQSALQLVDVLHYPFVDLMQYHSLQQSIETQAKLLGYTIQYCLRLPNFAAIAQVVANEVGIAIMPKRAANRLKKVYAFHQVELTGDWAN
mgnify:CR=1 FL=1